MSQQSMLARAKTVAHDRLGKTSSGNKLPAAEESSIGSMLAATQELWDAQEHQAHGPKTESPLVRPVPPYGDHRVLLLRSPLSLARARLRALPPSLPLSLSDLGACVAQEAGMWQQVARCRSCIR